MTATDDPMVTLDSIVKTYKVRGGVKVEALRELDLTISRGEILGLLGRNGAGKSTVVKLVCGLQQPTAGRVTVLGQDPTTRRSSLYRRLGVVFGQKTSLWWDLSVADNLAAMRGMYGIGRADHQRVRDELVEALSLGEVLRRPVRVLSLGERVKSEVACALLHRPELVVLDEPTIGLDLVSKHQLRSYLRTMVRSTGAAVLLTSHDTGDVTSSCDRIALLDGGRIIRHGSVDEVRRALDDSVRITVNSGEEPLTEDELARLDELRVWPVTRKVHVAEDLSSVVVTVASSGHADVVRHILSLDVADRGLRFDVAASSLEDGLLEHFRETAS